MTLCFPQSEVAVVGLGQIHYHSEFTFIIQESQVVDFLSLAWILQYCCRQGGLGWREALFQRMYSNANYNHILSADSVAQSHPALLTSWICSRLCPWNLQARILELVATSRWSSWLRGHTCIFCISCSGRWVLYHCATWEVPRSHLLYTNYNKLYFLLTFRSHILQVISFYLWEISVLPLIITIRQAGFQFLIF